MLQNIIPPRLKSVLTKRPQGSGGLWRKRALILASVVLALFVIGHLGVRFVLWPQIEKSKASIERVLSARLGTDVSMEYLEVSWVGIRPSFVVEGLRFNSPEKNKAPLQIQKISGELSWNSFYYLAPYFHELHFQGAQIYAERDSKGLISIAGIPVHGTSDNYSAENWLFSQKDIQVSDVKVFWDDQLNKKAIASIDIQSLNLSNGIRSHEGVLQATTPWTTGPIEIKLDLAHHLGGQAGNWRDWIGTISWNLSDLNLNQISKEFVLPLNTLEGKLSSRGKIKLDNSQPDGGEIFLAADNLTIQRSKGEDAIALGKLETNLIQDTDNGLISITTKTFAWRDMDSPKSAPLENLSPMTFRWKPPGADGEIKQFGFSSPKILVEDVALFALNLPLPKKVHQWIKASQADGELQDLDINWSESKSALSALNIPGGWFKSNKLNFTVSAKLVDLSFVGINKSMPTVSNLSGFITSDQNQGSFSINSNNLEIEINDLLADPKISLDRAKGQISWSKDKGNWVINTKQLALSNPEITATLNLNYMIGDQKKPDLMALDMDFAQANLVTAYRYLPVGMDKDTRLYLSKAFTGGTVQKGKLHIKGDPNQIPFPKASDGEFTLNLPISNATYSPVPLLPSNQGSWSTFTGLNGALTMQNANLTVDITKGNYKQVALTQFHAEIPSVSANQSILNVSGNVQGEAPQLLEYLFASPVGIKQSKLEKNLRIDGSTTLNLGLKIPLSGNGNTNVDLKLDFPGNRLQWSDMPPLENLKGKMRITEVNPEFEDVTANFLGGSFKIASAPATPGNQNFSVSGDIAASFIKQYFDRQLKTESTALLSAMSGSAQYDGLLSFNKASNELNLKFDLRNWASAAPAPMKKVLGASMTGQLSLRTDPKLGASRFTWNGKLGDLYNFQGDMSSNDELRYALGIGAPAILPQEGFQLNLSSAELNLDAWQTFLETQDKKSAALKIDSSSANNIQINAQVKKMIVFDRVWQDMNLTASNKSNAWQARLNSPLIAGQLQYQAANSSQPSGFLSGRLSRLKVPDEIIEPNLIQKPTVNGSTKLASKGAVTKNKLSPNSIPSLDLTIDDFKWSKADLGQVKLKTRTNTNLLKIDSIQASNAQGTSVISGQWSAATQNTAEHSVINMDMDVKDAGQIIAHWSPQKSVEGGQGKVSVNAEWDGSPLTPQYDTLSGKAKLNLENGRLLEVNTSGAKLLDVLSLQSLLRFATLDLKGSVGNIVTKGTPFNSIDTNFDISDGIAQTKQFNMILDQARVAMSGQINIPQKTQDLRVTIFPTIDATAGSLAAFAINPIVGLGALVGQYLITNQINRNLQSDYLVQGSWDDPEIIPLDQKGQPIDAKTLNTIRSKDLLKEQTKPSMNNAPTPTPQANPL